MLFNFTLPKQGMYMLMICGL